MGGPGSGPQKGGGSYPTEGQAKRAIKATTENVTAIKSQIASLEAQRAAVSARGVENNPAVKALMARHAASKAKVAKAGAKLAAVRARNRAAGIPAPKGKR